MFYQALTTGAGIITSITRPFIPSYILIGAVNLANPLRDISVTVGGDVTIKIAGITHVTAFCKYLMECLLGADVKVGTVIKLATGFIPQSSLELALTNDGATTPDIFGFSDSKEGVPVLAGQNTILADSSEPYSGAFTALIFSATNFDFAEITYTDGHRESKVTAFELATMFAMTNQADADGKLGGMLVIDNQESEIAGITLFADSGGSLLVTKVTII